ncbi:cofilin family protein [Streptomyces virginiae]|uniref:cofilin family protein n=1 Tax=Streptomyces virginiae TaxID=1961 RepID=UPI00224CBDED|nr:cofilin family protein [Streptomyces virginiae]MCX5174539.1 cofilin family protein [Streptomyces virginiae]
MSSPTGLSESSLAALRHMREQREINTVILRYAGAQGVLVPEIEGNLTHDELLQSLPADEPRLVVHELAFADPEGTRRHAQLLILWMPLDASEQEWAYSDGFTALREFLPDVHVHLTARRTDQLAYRRLVALSG